MPFRKKLKIENGLVAHVHEQVQDAKVGDESMLPGIDLIVRPGCECPVGQWVFGADGVAQVCRFGRFCVPVVSASVRRCLLNGGLYVEQPAHLHRDFEVEIVQKSPFLGEKRTDIVFIKFKKRTLTVSGY